MKKQKAIPAPKGWYELGDEWIGLPERIKCCDCGLVHLMEYRLEKQKGRDPVLQLRMRREE
jgi:hypothetical protein